METTTLDFAIMGLLLESPRTTYAIRKAFEETAIGNFSSSPGTIYPATKRLKKLKLVTDSKHESNILSITDKGKTEMKNWLNQPITKKEIAKQSSVLMLKFAFMESLLKKKEKTNFLQSMITLTKDYIKTLAQYHTDHATALPLHGRLAFEYGMESFKTQLTWAQSALKIIEK